MLSGTPVSDHDLDLMLLNNNNSNKDDEHKNNQKTIFGDLNLDYDELKVLELRPEFAIYDKLDKKKIAEEINITLTKIRWDRMNKDGDLVPQDENEDKEQEKQKELDRIEDAKSRMVYNMDNTTIDMGARKATDMAHNSRLILPQPRSATEEAILSTRQLLWKATTDQYIHNNCSKDGTQNQHNMSTSQRVGLVKLGKRIRSGELVVLPSDKGNRLTASSTESYQRQGTSHTTQDIKVSRKEVETNQTRLNNLSRGLAQIFKVGHNWGDRNAARCWGNAVTDSCIAPLLYPSPKTHKDLDESGDPRSRPVVQANSCLTSRPAEILADILDGALLSLPGQSECISTEDMLSRVDSANEIVKAHGVDICVGSGDAVALYPSLRHQESARLCAETIRECPARIANFNTQAAATFISTHCTSTEISQAGLGSILTKKKLVGGRFPTPSTPELTTRNKVGEDKDTQQQSKFLPVKDNLTDTEIKLLAAKVVEIGVMTVMRNHIYRWQDEYWLQTTGVPTGLRLSGIVGRITMDKWRISMLGLMNEHNMVNYLNEKYVDDCEVVTENLAPGSRWDGEQITTHEKDIAHDLDNNVALYGVTMEVWKEMASNIIPGLKFTTDYCSKSSGGTVPMLDFQLWKINEVDPEDPSKSRQALRYSFYEKPLANPKVMDSQSAMPHRIKIASLTQEGVRRLNNISRELDNKHKSKVLGIYMQKLRLSGYKQQTRANILECAVNTCRKKERAEILGIQPIHRKGTQGRAARIRTKVTGKSKKTVQVTLQ